MGQPRLTVGPQHSGWEATDERAGPVVAASPGAAEPCVLSSSVEGGGLLGGSGRRAGRLGGQAEGKLGPRLSTDLLCGLGEVLFLSLSFSFISHSAAQSTLHSLGPEICRGGD